MKRLVLMVEGPADVRAAPVLVKRLLPAEAWAHVILDTAPMEVGGITKLKAKEFAAWKRFLKAAAQRPKFGGALLLTDGDVLDKAGFGCPAEAARALTASALSTGAGQVFSLGRSYSHRSTSHFSSPVTRRSPPLGPTSPSRTTWKSRPVTPRIG